MANTKPVGVAYSDPLLDSLTVTNTSTLGPVTATTITASGAVSSPSSTTTTANGVQQTFSNAQTFSVFATAITANSTTTSQPSGSMGVTSHATGVGYLFMSDGTKWQYAKVA